MKDCEQEYTLKLTKEELDELAPLVAAKLDSIPKNVFGETRFEAKTLSDIATKIDECDPDTRKHWTPEQWAEHSRDTALMVWHNSLVQCRNVFTTATTLVGLARLVGSAWEEADAEGIEDNLWRQHCDNLDGLIAYMLLVDSTSGMECCEVEEFLAKKIGLDYEDRLPRYRQEEMAWVDSWQDKNRGK
jgi:hypothetical protein